MLRRFLTSIDKRGNKIPSQNRTGYLSSPPPRPQSGEEIPVASSIPQSIFLHKTRQYFIDIWRSCVSPLRFSQGRRLRASFGSGSSDAEILRCAQDDKTPGCHPERSEGSLGRLRPATLPHVASRTYGESPEQYQVNKAFEMY